MTEPHYPPVTNLCRAPVQWPSFAWVSQCLAPAVVGEGLGARCAEHKKEANVSETKTREHELKTWPEFYAEVESGRKTFEVRVNDRDYRVGDVLHLREWVPGPLSFYFAPYYTGRSCRRTVTYVMEGGRFGVTTPYVVMGLAAARGETKTDDSMLYAIALQRLVERLCRYLLGDPWEPLVAEVQPRAPHHEGMAQRAVTKNADFTAALRASLAASGQAMDAAEHAAAVAQEQVTALRAEVSRRDAEVERQKAHNKLLDGSLREERARRKELQEASVQHQERKQKAELRAQEMEHALAEVESRLANERDTSRLWREQLDDRQCRATKLLCERDAATKRAEEAERRMRAYDAVVPLIERRAPPASLPRVAEGEPLSSQIDRLAKFILAEVPGEPSQSEGAIDTAIRIMRTARAENERLRDALERLTRQYESEHDTDVCMRPEWLRAALAPAAPKPNGAPMRQEPVTPRQTGEVPLGAFCRTPCCVNEIPCIYHPMPAAPKIGPAPDRCVCGDQVMGLAYRWVTRGVVHRTDGPCYRTDPAIAPVVSPTPEPLPVIELSDEIRREMDAAQDAEEARYQSGLVKPEPPTGEE